MNRTALWTWRIIFTGYAAFGVWLLWQLAEFRAAVTAVVQ